MDRFTGDRRPGPRAKAFEVVQGVDTVDTVDMEWPMKRSWLDGVDAELMADDWMRGVPIEEVVVDSNWRRNMSLLLESVELGLVPVPSHASKSERSNCGEKRVESTRGLLQRRPARLTAR